MSNSEGDFQFTKLEDIEPVIQIVILRERMGRFEEFKESLRDRLKNYDVLFRWTLGIMLAGFIGLASLVLTLWATVQEALNK